MTTTDTVTYRPRKVRKVAWTMAIAVAVFFTIVGSALTGPTDSGKGYFTPSDQVAMIILGLLGGLAILSLTRPKVVADRHRVKIQNIVGSYDLPWDVVRGIRFERGNPWVTLELQDDDMVSIMAIQATDKQYAVEAARSLRALLAAHQASAGIRIGESTPDLD